MAESMSGQILAIARTMTKADESEQETLAMLCTAQEEALEKRLRDGVSKEACASAFICAAAFLTAAALEGARAGGEELSSLRAGDLTVTKRASGESGRRLEALCEQARMLMQPYTRMARSAFRGAGMKKMLSEAFERYGMSTEVRRGKTRCKRRLLSSRCGARAAKNHFL